MIGDFLVLEEDLYPVPSFVDLHLGAGQPFRHRVAVRVDMHVALQHRRVL